jgi:hypothetical protein
MLSYTQAFMLVRQLEKQFTLSQDLATSLDNLTTAVALLSTQLKKLPANATIKEKTHQDSVEQCIATLQSLRPLVEVLRQAQDNRF